MMFKSVWWSSQEVLKSRKWSSQGGGKASMVVKSMWWSDNKH